MTVLLDANRAAAPSDTVPACKDSPNRPIAVGDGEPEEAKFAVRQLSAEAPQVRIMDLFFPLVAEAHDRVGGAGHLVSVGAGKTPAQNGLTFLSVNHVSQSVISPTNDSGALSCAATEAYTCLLYTSPSPRDS